MAQRPHGARSADQARAIHDVTAMVKLFDIVLQHQHINPDMLMRVAHLHSMAHNLGLPTSADTAQATFERMLAQAPKHPQGNYLYGTFLANTRRAQEALPYLDQALQLGVANAAYAKGFAYLVLGDTEQALQNLEHYQQHRPRDTRVGPLIEAVRSGTLQLQLHPG